ncbi:MULTISPECIES: GNAT family N-acetyltransferase [Rhizobium]|uniref:Acetyltransferase (GNAT) domain-containing protein n=1 Tax=Rhizobium miluonense TaxID=411945 RepID=A0A1C3WVP8_9HYPH|nr:GNAT family N-acetyltransferase [Rhizobium miluonense]SCB44041.1 Acetyltransferase (GNAT) domain-containing protein [Rhizobium miluonense]
MRTDDINLVSFTSEHIDGAVALSRQANWPHRAEDWHLVLRLSHGVAAVDEAGRVVGTIFMTPYGGDCATISMVIVDEGMRGRGLGRKLMDEAITLAGDRSLRLIATAEGLPLYCKLGFVVEGEIFQHQGHLVHLAQGGEVETATAGDFSAIKALDRAAFGADRSALIDFLADVAQAVVIRRNGRIEAYGALRAFGRGDVIGPVIAPSAEDAKSLITALAFRRSSDFLRVDTNDGSGLGDWLAEIGLNLVGGGIAMRRPAGGVAVSQDARIFALANQALG